MRLPPECDQQLARYGADHPFTLDCLVRHLQEFGWSGAVALGHDQTVGPLIITAGIGCLTVSPEGVHFQSATKPTSVVEPRPAPVDLARARLEACASCSRYEHGRCTVAGCGCSGIGQRSQLNSRCPLGRWPVVAVNP